MPIDVKNLTPLVQVFNMPRSLAFYRDILGFEVLSDSGGGDNASWVWMQLNNTNLMLNDQYEPGNVPKSPADQRTKWHGDTCLYFECPDIDAAFEHLRSSGINIDPPVIAPYGMQQLYVSDPDGYNICFQRRVDNETG